MELLLMLLISSIVLIFFLHGVHLYRRRRMPPGPAGFPIIGSLLDIGPKPHQSLANLSRKHGPLMTVRLGSITTVVASTPDAAREVLQRNDEACSGRIVPDAVTAIKDLDVSVLWISANDDWRTIRKALNIYLTHQHKLDTLRCLRETVVDGMLDHLHLSAAKPAAVDVGKLAFAVALNQMSNTIMSQDVTTYDSVDMGGFGTAVKTVMEVDGKFNIADIFPVLKRWDPQRIRRQAKEAYGWFDSVTDGYIRERLKDRESKVGRLGDVLDSLLDYHQDHEDEFSLQHIKALLVVNY